MRIVARRPSVNYRQQFSLWICIQSLILVCFLSVPSAALAGDVVVIGGTERQKRFVSCVAKVSANELRALPNSDQPMTFLILEQQKFLQARDAFHANRTKLAFSNLAIRRIYLSSPLFTDSHTPPRRSPPDPRHLIPQPTFARPSH